MELLNLSVVQTYGYVFLEGLAMTVFLTLVTFALAVTIAVPLAVARLTRSRILRWPADAFVEFIRATPLILQLIYIFYVLPGVGLRLDPVTAAIVGLTMNYSAYMSEVYRSGIVAVPRGQYEAAISLGLPWRTMFMKVILPQAVRIVLPALGNYLISLFKDTALASVVTVQELMFRGEIIASRNYQYFTVYTVTAILYFVVSYPSALFVRRLSGGRRTFADLGA